jgi:LysM repeat protein
MTTTIDCERETIDFDSIHEYLRDAHLPSREAAVSMSSNVFHQRQSSQEAAHSQAAAHSQPAAQAHHDPKSDELETLYPGVHHDFRERHDFSHHQPQRASSFYLSIGFAAGALVAMAGVFVFNSVSHMVTAKSNSPEKTQIAANSGPALTPLPGAPAGGDVLVPATQQYQVQPGDTLAGIALHNYKKVSPRLLDEICRANNMRNANVLSLGQKLVLPEYHPNAAGQIAATPTTSVQ